MEEIKRKKIKKVIRNKKKIMVEMQKRKKFFNCS